VGGNARRRAVAPAANGARQAVRRRVWPRHLAPPAAVNVTHRSPPAQRSDHWTFRHLGVCARRGYGAYDGAPTWPRATSRAERASAFQGKFSLLNKFQTRFSLNFETKLYLSSNSKDVDQVSLFKIYKGRYVFYSKDLAESSCQLGTFLSADE
jgi:hypothetical protein